MSKSRYCPFCGSNVSITKGLINAPFWFFNCKNPYCGAIISFNNKETNMEPSKALDYFEWRYDNGEKQA